MLRLVQKIPRKASLLIRPQRKPMRLRVRRNPMKLRIRGKMGLEIQVQREKRRRRHLVMNLQQKEPRLRRREVKGSTQRMMRLEMQVQRKGGQHPKQLQLHRMMARVRLKVVP